MSNTALKMHTTGFMANSNQVAKFYRFSGTQRNIKCNKKCFPLRKSHFSIYFFSVAAPPPSMLGRLGLQACGLPFSGSIPHASHELSCLNPDRPAPWATASKSLNKANLLPPGDFYVTFRYTYKLLLKPGHCTFLTRGE